MSDARVARLAELVAGYSLELREGQVVRIDGSACTAPLMLELYRAALRCGAHPYLNAGLDRLGEILLEEGSPTQIEFVSPVAVRELENVDALITVWGDENTQGLSGVDPECHRLRLAAGESLRSRRWERIAAGELRWCGTQFPGRAHAQDAGMSLPAYEDFVFRACHVDGSADPADHWRSTAAGLEARARRLEAARELRIVGPDTDLRVGVAGRKWVAADGRLNLPDGEVFTGPLETATEGQVRFQFPAIYRGREVEDVRLRFAGGEVVHAEAARGAEFLGSVLDAPGARILGEVAFGMNFEIDRFTRNILFDEKIGGTMHLALGSSFPQTGGTNLSGVHWDMICDLRAEGEVYADGELVWQAGRFLDGADGGDA